MIRRFFLAGIAFLALGAASSWATNVALTLTTSDPLQTTGTWTLTATLSDNQTLGIAAFSIDMHGGSDAAGSATVLKAATVANTLAVTNPPYALFRNTGTLAAPNLTGIGASQDTISAGANMDPSLVRVGDGLTTDATGQFWGPVAHGGPLTLATGRWSTTGMGNFIQAVLAPATTINLFPLNYAVDDGAGGPPPAGAAQNTMPAVTVASSQMIHVGPVPEPGTLVLMGLGGLGLALVARRRAG